MTFNLADLAARSAGRRVLVLGDAILDGWIEGVPDHLCREAPVPVVAVGGHRYAPGGAANTAVNLAALGARTVLVAPVGADDDGRRLRAALGTAGVDARLVEVDGRRTVAKRRLVASGQIMIRFDEGDTGPLRPDDAGRLGRVLDAALADGVDAVVVGDYGCGAVGDPVRTWLAEHRDRVGLLVVDAHDPAGWAPVRPDVMTPSFAEATRLVAGLHGRHDGARPEAVHRHAAALLRASGAGHLAVTLDVDGSVVLSGGHPAHRTYAEPVPASHTVGAGDAYAAALTLGLLAALPLPEAAELAQRAATESTRTPGTAVLPARAAARPARAVPATPDGPADAAHGPVEAGQLLRSLAGHRARGERVVFTNGCFDVLHPGHVRYLRQARALGDVLVVAVNSDDSVRRLKGPERPVNPVEDRVALLAALAAVDYVVVFGEDSPAPLIERVRPEVYVKGGDYPPELLPERPLVERLGGAVHVLDYVPDRSTTMIIDRIRRRATADPSRF